MAKPIDLRDLEKYTRAETELERVLTVKEAGTMVGAANRLGISVRALFETLARLRRRRDDDEAGIIEFNDAHVPMDQQVAGISKMVRTEEGLPMWIKMKKDAEEERRHAEEIWAGWSEKLPRAPIVRRRPTFEKQSIEELMNVYLVTDYHMGMKAFADETRGAHWDTKIAEQLLVDWFRGAIEAAPPAKVGVFAQLGDFAHWDGLLPETPTSKHLLDADTRFQYMTRVCIRVFRTVVNMLLQKYEKVIIMHAEGNHDPASSAHFREWSAVLYEDDDRVEVLLDMDPYYLIRWGSIAVAFHHGHLTKMAKLDKVLAAKFRQHYGQTQHFYAHMGHLHHDYAIETDLMTIEQHQTLAAPDAYASRHGYSSARSAKVLTYHQEFGEVERRRLVPDAVQ